MGGDWRANYTKMVAKTRSYRSLPTGVDAVEYTAAGTPPLKKCCETPKIWNVEDLSHYSRVSRRGERESWDLYKETIEAAAACSCGWTLIQPTDWSAGISPCKK